MRFVLLDRITSVVPGERGTALKNVTFSEDYFDDHFPSMPIMPGVLMLEGMAQLSGLVLEEGATARLGRRMKALMSIVERAKFRSPARPGDQLEFTTEVQSINDIGGRAAARAEIAGKKVAECTLTFSFHDFDHPRLRERQERIVSLLMKGTGT